MKPNRAMITVAREAREWLQKELADAIGVKQATISKYENGMIDVPEYHVRAIADVLRFDVGFFYNRMEVFGIGGDFLYRRKARVSAKTRRRVEAEANIRRMCVENMLRSAVIAPSVDFPAVNPGEVGGKAEYVARAVRKMWSLPDGPIENLTRCIERAGGVVLPMDFQTNDIDGTNIRVPGSPPLIFINMNAPGERSRYSLAHELGHVVMHFSPSVNDAEEEAHEFANELLMPKRAISRDLRNLDLNRAAGLKRFWKVSMAALIRRARSLRAISEYAYRNMMKKLSSSGMRLVEPYPVERERAESYDKLVEFHQEELGMTRDDLRRILFTDELGPIPVTKQKQLRLVDDLPTLWEN